MLFCAISVNDLDAVFGNFYVFDVVLVQKSLGIISEGLVGYLPPAKVAQPPTILYTHVIESQRSPFCKTFVDLIMLCCEVRF